MLFYVGVHHPYDAQHFERAFVSINSIRGRKSAFPCQRWIMDSGAFTEISRHGGYRHEPEAYAADIERWRTQLGFQMAVTQDYMCEPFILQITGLSVRRHQELTIERYVRIRNATAAYVMPVLQGYTLEDYRNHLDMYWSAGLLNIGMRVGIGSVCKRNKDLSEIEEVVHGVAEAAPGLRLHGFGVKTTALQSPWVWNSLFSADSMAWSYAARREGRDANDWREGKAFEERIHSQHRLPRPRPIPKNQRPVQQEFLLA